MRYVLKKFYTIIIEEETNSEIKTSTLILVKASLLGHVMR